jgi:hypothetical protein
MVDFQTINSNEINNAKYEKKQAENKCFFTPKGKKCHGLLNLEQKSRNRPHKAI